ncbi:MAG: hypothetical protein MJ176_01210 [Treponema sp.]|nr:hypothetical protein [Treponema sp.]
MEKFRINFRRRFVQRLLSFVLWMAAVSPLWAAAPSLSKSQIDSLKILPDPAERLITDREIKFTLSIPLVSSSEVEVRTPSFPEGIIFKSFRKTNNYSTGGTKLEMWITFEKPGLQNPGQLETYIQNRRYFIPFADVNISANPKDLFPQLIVVPSKKSASYFKLGASGEITGQSNKVLPAGTPLTFDLYLKYAQRAVSFNHNLPENCLFTQDRTVDYTEIKKSYDENSQNLIDLGTCTWTPLYPGTADFPLFIVDAYNYSNYKNQITSPLLKIEIGKGNSLENAASINDDSSLFADAFYIEQTNDPELAREATEEEMALSWKNILKRKKLLNLLFLSLIFITVLLAALLFWKRRWKLAFIALGIALVLLLSKGIFLNKDRLVFSGTVLYSIPEDNAKSTVPLKKGTTVTVEEKSGDWLYVKSDSTGGWAKKGDFYGHE